MNFKQSSNTSNSTSASTRFSLVDRVLLITAALVLFSVFGGCAFIPMTISTIFAGDGSKAERLQKSVSTLHKSLQWGDPMIAAEVVSPEMFSTYYQKMVGDPRKMKVLDVVPGQIEIDKPEKDQAYTIADVRVFGSPTYAVKTLSRKEIWEYTGMHGHWVLVGLEELPVGDE